MGTTMATTMAAVCVGWIGKLITGLSQRIGSWHGGLPRRARRTLHAVGANFRGRATAIPALSMHVRARTVPAVVVVALAVSTAVDAAVGAIIIAASIVARTAIARTAIAIVAIAHTAIAVVAIIGVAAIL